MKKDFLRPPHTPGEWLADTVRLLGVVSVLVAGLGWQLTDAGILALALPALLLPRMLGLRSGFDIAYGVIVLIAAWSNVLGWYERVAGWDLLVHAVCTGVVAVTLYLLLARWAVVPPPRGESVPPRTPIILVATLGLALGALWEMVEWAGKTFITSEISVSYVDTIGDLAAGGVGAVAAGILASAVRLERRR